MSVLLILGKFEIVLDRVDERLSLLLFEIVVFKVGVRDRLLVNDCDPVTDDDFETELVIE